MTKTKPSTNSNARGTVAKIAKGQGPTEARVPASEKPEAGAPADGAPQTKQALVLGLLQRKQGASLGELVEATGWLPQTTRAALTRLRQSGHELQKEKRETGETAYRIAAAHVT